jgi:hypothetical protein
MYRKMRELLQEICPYAIEITRDIGRGERILTSDPLVPKKGLGCRTECFESLTVVLQPFYSCSITTFEDQCKSSMEVRGRGLILAF